MGRPVLPLTPVAPLSKTKSTKPVGAPAPGAFACTVAWNKIVCAATCGVPPETTLVDRLACPTSWLAVAELGAKLTLPLYVALIVCPAPTSSAADVHDA